VTITAASCRTELDFYLNGSVRRGDVQSGCSEARTHLDIDSPSPADAVERVVDLAHQGCFLEQMIARPVPLRTSMTLNGIVHDGEETGEGA
jgi:hypothetical protein